MGQLYDNCRTVIDHIDSRAMDGFRTRGAIAMRAGFLVTLVEPSDPDDPVKLDALRQAAKDVLELELE